MIDVQPLMHTVDMARIDRQKAVGVPPIEPHELKDEDPKQTPQ